MSLEEATDRLIEDLRLSNQGMRIIRSPENIRVDGQQALSTDLSNESPLGGRETNWLVTVTRPEGVLFFVFVAPDRRLSELQPHLPDHAGFGPLPPINAGRSVTARLLGEEDSSPSFFGGRPKQRG